MNNEHEVRAMAAETAYPEEILIVDDSAGNLKLLGEILTAGGYRVRLAGDGVLALRSALIQPPALVLLDIRMPGMDGFEVCRRLKADGATCNIPVIFLSILEDEGDKVKGFRLGAVDYVTKPFHPEEVLARVTMHLALKSARQALEARNAELEENRATLEERVLERTAALESANRELRRLKDELELRVLERTAELEAKNTELEKMLKAFVGRELKMVELKERIKELENISGVRGGKDA